MCLMLEVSEQAQSNHKYTRLCKRHAQFTLCVHLMDALYTNFDSDLRAVNVEESSPYIFTANGDTATKRQAWVSI